MRKTKNEATIIGRVYDKSNLVLKKVANEKSEHFGEDFIGGSIDIATDDAGLNIVTVYFTFVQPTYKSGKQCTTFGVLKNIIDNGKTVLEDGAENATLVKIDGSIGLNDFITSRNGQETLVSAKRNMGSFASIINKLPEEKECNTFLCDMLINGTQYVEADEEKKIAEDYLIVKGAIFDFRGALLPIDFKVKNAGGIKYFESLDASSSNPTFTRVWGNINCSTIVEKREEESAFGEPMVKEFSKTVREYVIVGTAKPENVYEIGDEQNGITVEEVKKAMADREVHLAEVKKKNDEYQASKNAGSANSVATAPAAAGGFNF